MTVTWYDNRDTQTTEQRERQETVFHAKRTFSEPWLLEVVLGTREIAENHASVWLMS